MKLVKQEELQIVASEIQKKITKKHQTVSKIPTPKGMVKKKQGFDYVELSYMKRIANEEYPGWSWTIIKSEALGSEAYVVHGRLKWYDEGIWREGDMVAAHRIQKLRGKTEFVDVGNDIKAANTDTMKKAFNVYMDIAGDVYRTEDPTLEQEEIDAMLDLVQGSDMEDEINEKLTNGSINALNYKGSMAKLKRIINEK
tara:strand:- start:652 stop:1245 length:594 start_codon:yes stop_codon:yes gene_type:complete